MNTQLSDPNQAVWNNLLFFKIFKEANTDQNPTLRVFNNRRQQCRVRVLIRAAYYTSPGSNTPVTLTDAQLRSIQLVEYWSGNPLTRSDVSGEGHADWQYTHVKRDYEWDEAMIPGAADDDTEASGEPGTEPYQGAAQSIDFYVSSRVANGSVQIAARIQIPGTTEFVRTNNLIPENDHGTGDGNGSFNSSVTVRSVAFPSLSPSDYGVLDTTGNLMAHSVGNINHFYWAREHYLHVHLNNQFLRLKTVSGTQGGITGFGVCKKAVIQTTKWSISYYGQPGRTATENFPLPPLDHVERAAARFYPPTMLSDCGAATLVGANATRVVVGLLMGNLDVIFRTSSGTEVGDRNDAILYIMDVYGNEHALRLQYGSMVNQIRVSKA